MGTREIEIGTTWAFLVCSASVVVVVLLDHHWTMARNGVPLVAGADVGAALPAGGLPLPFAALGRTTLWLWLWF